MTLTKNRGVGLLWLTRHPTNRVCPERPSRAEGPLLNPTKDSCPEEPAATGDEGPLFTPDEGCLS
jgi:hypothetical protein